MKKLAFLLLICLTNAMFSFAQKSYDKMVDTTKMWVIIRDISPLYNYQPSTAAYRFKDSIQLTDSNYWYGLYESKDEGYHAWKFLFYVREIDSVVVCHNCMANNSSTIDTLYNFKKKIAENLSLRADHEVILTDTLTEFFIGKNRFKQIISGWNGDNYEGIGNTFGLLRPLFYDYTGSHSKILCFFINNKLIYKDLSYEHCYISTNINDLENSENIKIFPNPSDGNINVLYPSWWSNSVDIKVLNPLGVTIFHDSNFNHSSNIFLNQKGIFIVKIKYDNTIYNQLLIIK